MIKQQSWHINMPNKVKRVLDTLIEKAEVKNCVDADRVKEIKNRLTWGNLPTILDDTLVLLGVEIVKDDKTMLGWMEVPKKLALLSIKVDNLDCRSLTLVEDKQEQKQEEEVKTEEDTSQETEEQLPIEEQKVEEVTVPVSNITLVEYSKDEDLSGENESVHIQVYFEDKSGDEIPNVGKKLFTDKNLLIPFVDYKGAFYFIRPSKIGEKETILVRGTGTVKKTKFQV